jgi:hypothetical protein
MLAFGETGLCAGRSDSYINNLSVTCSFHGLSLQFKAKGAIALFLSSFLTFGLSEDDPVAPCVRMGGLGLNWLSLCRVSLYRVSLYRLSLCRVSLYRLSLRRSCLRLRLSCPRRLRRFGRIGGGGIRDSRRCVILACCEEHYQDQQDGGKK